MKMIIDELVTILGLDIETGVLPKIQKFQGMIDNVVKSVSHASATLLGAASGIAYFADRMNRTSSHLAILGDLTGLNTDQLQRFGQAAILAGGHADEMQQDIVHLYKSMNPAIPGEINQNILSFFGGTGVSQEQLKDPIKAMDLIQKRMQDFTKIEQVQWAERMGFSQTGTLFLTQKDAEYSRAKEKAWKTVISMSPKELADTKEYVIQMELLTTAFNKLGQRVASVAAPAMEKLTGNFSAFMEKHKETIELGLQYVMSGIIQGFNDFGDTLVHVQGFFGNWIKGVRENFPTLDEFITKLGNLNIVANLVHGALAAISALFVVWGVRLMVLHPYITLIAGAVALIATNWEWVEKNFNSFCDAVQTRGEALKKYIDDIAGFGPQGENYNAKDSGIVKKVGSSLFDFATSPFIDMWNILSSANKAAPMLNGAQSKSMNENVISITQHISVGEGTDTYHEVKRATVDALNQTFPGGLVPVVN